MLTQNFCQAIQDFPDKCSSILRRLSIFPLHHTCFVYTKMTCDIFFTASVSRSSLNICKYPTVVHISTVRINLLKAQRKGAANLQFMLVLICVTHGYCGYRSPVPKKRVLSSNRKTELCALGITLKQPIRVAARSEA
jgi:hypothetical protein